MGYDLGRKGARWRPLVPERIGQVARPLNRGYGGWSSSLIGMRRFFPSVLGAQS